MNIRRATGENWVSLDEWAEFRGSSLDAEAHRAARGHYVTHQFPSEKHQGKLVTCIALHRLDRKVQQEYNRWRQDLGPQGAERALAEIESGSGAGAARQARERYEAVQAYLAIEPRTVVIEGRRVPSRAVVELCQEKNRSLASLGMTAITPRTLRRWAEAFQAALDEARTPQAAYRAFQVLIPRKGGRVLRPEQDGRLKLRIEDELLIQGLWLKRSRPDVAAIFEQIAADCIRCWQGPMIPVHRGFKGRYLAHRCQNPECGFQLSYATVRAAVRKTPPSAAALGRIGPKFYDDKFARYAARNWRGARRNEVVFGDHHEVDDFVWEPERPFHADGKTPRIFCPWISPWQDMASGVVAYRLGLSPNSELLNLAFRAYILRFGVPQSAWCDHGKDYAGERFETVCANLGVDLHHALPSKRETGESHARSKPIERWFGTLERDLIRELPGWRGSNTQERDQRRDLEARWLRQHAEFLAGQRRETPLLTYDELAERIQAYTEQHYHAMPASRQDRAPLDAFTADSQPVHTISERALDLLLMEAKSRIVGPNGVSVFGRQYWSARFALLKREPCKALVDPGDLGQVIVLVKRSDGVQECIVAEHKPLAGFTEQDIQRERQLAREERRVVQEYRDLCHRAAAGVKPLHQVWLEKQRAAQALPTAVGMQGSIPLVTEGHRIARALENVGAGFKPAPTVARPERPRIITSQWDAEHPEDKDDEPRSIPTGDEPGRNPTEDGTG